MRAIGDICQDVVDQLRLELGAGSGAATEALRPGPHNRRDETAAAFEFVATAHLSGGGENRRLCAGGVAQTGIKDGGATELSPTQLPSPWEVWTGNGVRKVGIEIATVSRRKRTMPQGSAVVISIAAYRESRWPVAALG
jgi:hypothetical protein